MEFKEGQNVSFNGKQTHIENIYDDETCRIANPDWDWDEEAACVANGIDYDVPYWITVKLSKINTPADPADPVPHHPPTETQSGT
jgi:hypothetical protein